MLTSDMKSSDGKRYYRYRWILTTAEAIIPTSQLDTIILIVPTSQNRSQKEVYWRLRKPTMVRLPLKLFVVTVLAEAANVTASFSVISALQGLRYPFLAEKREMPPNDANRDNLITPQNTYSVPKYDLIVSLRGGGNVDDFVGGAYDWCINLGAPAALIAGAVIATLYENIRGGQLELRKGDSTYVMATKKVTNLLLLSAFALQILSIFVTTVTGTMLKSRDFSSVTTIAHSALGFLREKYEFEYLTSRLSFLQGLLHWLIGVALEHTIPRKGEGQAARKMDQFVAVSMITLVMMLLSFYNTHITAYSNYWEMVVRWVQITTTKYLGKLYPMMLLYIPGIVLSLYTGALALQEGAYSEERDD